MSSYSKGSNAETCMDSDHETACKVCGLRINLLRCSRCKVAYYCSKEHQRADWKRHKGTCSVPLTVESTAADATTSVGNSARKDSPRPTSEQKSTKQGSSEGVILKAATERLSIMGRLGINPGLSYSFDTMCQNVIRDLNAYGVCLVDNFLGEERGHAVANEVIAMHQQGVFRDGQLVSKSGDPKSIRGDQITWVTGQEGHVPNIEILINAVDNVIKRANTLPRNGLLGKYDIRGRTKAMVACYPGGGTHYVQHVDNPHQDGRCITAIYYLNEDWNVERDGGLLRIFSGGPKGDKVADVSPSFDRLLFFWSDRRNPHEVQPAHRTRYAITLWYFDAAERREALKRYEEEHSKS